MDDSLIQCLWHSKETLACLTPYAYQPIWIYTFLVVMMLLSAIGLPFPEEATLVSVGVLAYMGSNPDKYPPPYEGAPHVHAETAAIVAFLIVWLSDFWVYGVGRLFGRRIFEWKPIKSVLSEKNRLRIEEWTQKYGAYACGIFRFTPGIRFPGHLACGMLKFPAWKFLVIDGIAALISVPTQILLLAYYGDHILYYLKQFKIGVLIVLVILGLYFLYKKYFAKRAVA
ncbi:DedA family protein [Pseudobdellovibrio exovorus]|uniref:DedA protein n=1 Tax=Pseudobdellovibrio exovorus JSS TaxID=1184267 RepID=M4V7N4_9BACT|nr:DedA family protein [Pseudobdellovibrio exovorus]AGH95228.1 dedA protein [Pseudobdellovibrio exovorus JSS]